MFGSGVCVEITGWGVCDQNPLKVGRVSKNRKCGCTHQKFSAFSGVSIGERYKCMGNLKMRCVRCICEEMCANAKCVGAVNAYFQSGTSVENFSMWPNEEEKSNKVGFVYSELVSCK